ncbi:MAG: hypothetical protein WB778_06625 [Thermoplasmata archaeon]
MREGIANQTRTRPRILWSGAILVTLGLSVLLAVGEWLAAFDACLANPDCVPADSVSTLEGYLAIMAIGVGVAVFGVLISPIGFRTRAASKAG